MPTIRKTCLSFVSAASLIIVPLLGACEGDADDESAASASQASHPEVTLTGSNFEIDTDANLKLDDPVPSIDWASVSEVRNADTLSGPDDESFGQGSKEDTASPVIVDGSIPPNKSDLKFFGVYQEGTTSSGFLNMFWSRVQDPTGTTNMDFEFNQNYCDPITKAGCSANGVTPARLPGDLLIIYDLAQGGTHPVLSIREWTGSAWGPASELTSSGKATGSINTSPIPAVESDGLGAQDPRTFGEAQVALSAIFDPNECQTFGSAYLKSRSSDSFTAALKDFVPPVAVNISNCGSIKIQKTDDAGSPLAGAEFTLYQDNPPLGGSRGVEDTLTTHTCTTDSAGECTITNVLAGQYWVVETVTPPNHDSAPEQHAIVVADEQILLSFVNPRHRGAIKIIKKRKHAADGAGDHPHAGVGFEINGDATPLTDADGVVCVDNLLFGTYTVHEILPFGYMGEADKQVIVDTKATCSETPYVGESVTFTNTPVSGLTVSFSPTIVGGTVAKISCSDGTMTLASNPVDSTPMAFDDVSENYSDLLPGTYTCTVVIDP